MREDQSSELRRLAIEVGSLAEVVGSAELPGALHDTVEELLKQAKIHLQDNHSKAIRARVEALRDGLWTLRGQLGLRVFGGQITQTYAPGCKLSAASLAILAENLKATLDREQQQDRERALRRLEVAAIGASWKTGECETVFEPWQPGDRVHIWFARFRGRLREYAAWWIDERWVPLALVLAESANALGLEESQLAAIDAPKGALNRAQHAFVARCFLEVLANKGDEGARRRVAAELGLMLERDAEHVPWFHWYFELLPARARELLERAATRSMPERADSRRSVEGLTPTALPPITNKEVDGRDSPPASTAGSGVSLEFRDGNRPSFHVRAASGLRGPVECTLRGKTRAHLARLVMEQPGQDHTWQDLLKSGLQSGRWTIASPDTLRRQGERVRACLPAELQGFWEQDRNGVRWTLT